jgi:hypothetical protein
LEFDSRQVFTLRQRFPALRLGWSMQLPVRFRRHLRHYHFRIWNTSMSCVTKRSIASSLCLRLAWDYSRGFFASLLCPPLRPYQHLRGLYRTRIDFLLCRCNHYKAPSPPPRFSPLAGRGTNHSNTNVTNSTLSAVMGSTVGCLALPRMWTNSADWQQTRDQGE